MNRHELTLDLDKSVMPRYQQTVVLRQGDLHGCEIAAQIADHGEPVSTGLTPYLVVCLPSGSYYRASAEWSDGRAVATIDETYAAAETGRMTGYFELRDGEEVIATTQNVLMRSIASGVGGELAEPYDAAIQDALDSLNEGIEEVGELTSQFLILSESDIDALFG